MALPTPLGDHLVVACRTQWPFTANSINRITRLISELQVISNLAVGKEEGVPVLVSVSIDVLRVVRF